MSPVVKKQKEKFSLPTKYILMILTALSIGLMVITFTIDFKPQFLNNALGYVITPMQSGLSKFGSLTNSKVRELIELGNVREENELLKKQVQELINENIRFSQDEYELNQLRSLFEIKGDYSEYDITAAQIISKDTSNWYSTFVIDKGMDDGLAVDMNVLSESGLIGRIIAVGNNWAKVSSIIEDNSNVYGTVLSTKDNLLVSGNLISFQEGRILFSQLHDSGNLVNVGDKIVTSNISDKYLPNILIGYITEIEDDPNNLTKSGKIVPYTDFEHLDTVIVIRTLKQQVE